MSISKVVCNFCLNQNGEKVSFSDLISGRNISIVSNSVPVLVQVTKESYYDAGEFYTFYGFKQEINNFESAYSSEKSSLLSSIHTLACIIAD